MNIFLRWHWLLALLVLSQQSHGQKEATTLSMCGSDELCVTEQLCQQTDDAGRGAIGPRIARTCGKDLVCCDREQLESWNATMEIKSGQTISRNSGGNSTPSSATEEASVYESCGLKMECVPRKLCRDDVIIDDGRSILNPRIGDVPCRRVLFRCCAIDQQVDEAHSPYRPKLGKFKYQGCGYSNEKGLIPDQDNFEYPKDGALFAEFPWMLALIGGRNMYVCGGTLIHPQLVLTSAHNIRNHTEHTLVVRAGEWDLNSVDEPHAHQARRIKQIIRHEDFDPEAHFNDIALLVLEEPFEIQPHIQPICLPPPETPALQSQLREALCYATGWGGRQPDSVQHEHLLKRIDLPVISRTECQAQLRVTRLGKRFRLRPSFICAGGDEGKDTCKGDGGSPLACTLPGEQNRYQLAGIVSWGIECAKEDVPAVYANVPYLRPWIDEKVKALGLQLEAP